MLAGDPMPMDAGLDGADVLTTKTCGDENPRANEPEIDGGGAAKRQPHPFEHEESVCRQPEKHRGGGIRDTAHHDVDGRFDLDALWRSQRQVEKFVGRLVERESEPL